MFRKGIILFVVVFFPILCHGQVSREKKARKLIDKQQYHSAYVLLRKALDHDSGSVGAKYVLAQYYAAPQNEDFELDSAYSYINRAIRSWQVLPAREQAALRRFPLDSLQLKSFMDEIESRAFEEAKAVNTEEKLNEFVRFYPASRLQGAAIILRDEAAFRDASKTNTPAAFLEFIQKYPTAVSAKQAREQYDYLIFQEGTKDRNLSSYTSYLEENPRSPYRKEVEKNIFEIVTAEGTPESFAGFIGRYPQSYFARRAADLLFHLVPEDRRVLYAHNFNNDSLRKAMQLENSFLVPFLQKGRFGLMNENGTVIIEPEMDELNDEYLCGNVAEDLVVIPGKVITRDGQVVMRKQVTSLEDVGSGFVIAGVDEGNILLHKSGFVFSEKNIEDAKLVSGQLLAIQKNKLWGLFTLTGRNILPYEAGDIFAIENVIVFQTGSKFTLSTVGSLAGIVNNQKGRFTDAFDEVRKISGNNVWIREKNYEGVLDQKLEILVAMDTHQITPANFGVVSVSARGQSTYNEFGEQSEVFSRIHVVNPWVAVRNNSGWMLFDPRQRMTKSISYDSIAIHGSFAVGIRKDGLEIHAHTNPGNPIIVPPQDHIEYLSANDTVSCLLLQKDKKSTVFNEKGVKMFTATFDRIQYAGDGLFIVSKKEKKGLINAAGKPVLSVEYDAIGTPSNGIVSVLRSMKFGLFDYRLGKLIKPEYEKNITKYNNRVLSVYKNGTWGFVSLENKPLSKMEFQEIIPWTDSVALVRRGDHYIFHNVFTGNSLMDNIKSYQIIRNLPDDRLFIIRQNEDMGVINHSMKFAIPLKFSDIVNVGSAEKPVYFTEKHVREASLFVVIYYDSDSRLIRREVYEQDEYDRVYCNGKK